MSDTKETVKTMEQEVGSVKAPTLTLDPGERKIDMSFMEPSLGKMEIAANADGTPTSAGSVDESMLSE